MVSEAKLDTVIASLKPGDIIFTRDNSVISWLLRFLQGSFPYSHVCLAGEPGTIYTTTASGFAHVSARMYLRRQTGFAVKRWEVGLTPIQMQACTSFCQAQLGEYYPYDKVARIIISSLRERGVKTVVKAGGSHKDPREFCAEQVAATYMQMGIRLTPVAENTDFSGYTPSELWYDSRLIKLHEVS